MPVAAPLVSTLHMPTTEVLRCTTCTSAASGQARDALAPMTSDQCCIIA